ncbi:unnamed protein product [Moneuplotes crassus]|uniref:Uncharacterized protein n=1 Tax=Euplotes crassus TaxID=5936 RepID=A0AAD1U4V9_EUPCR|nr:unnamed protein product [Moneuplotes crassus]
METIVKKKITITHKLSLLSILVPYYGYISECAELLLQLDKKSREIWLGSLKPILGVIMDFKKSTLIKEIKGVFTKSNANRLLAFNNHLYFSLSLNLKSVQSFRAIMYFIDQMAIYHKDQFYDISIELNERSLNSCQRFMEAYLRKGFDCSHVYFDYETCAILLQKHCIKNSFYSYNPCIGLDLIHTFESLCDLNISESALELKKSGGSMTENVQRMLENNYKLLSITPQTLKDLYMNRKTVQFEHRICSNIQMDVGLDPSDLFNQEYLRMMKGLEILLNYVPNLSKVSFHDSSMLQNLLSQCFSHNLGNFVKLPTIKTLKFYNNYDQSEERLDLKVNKAEVIYIDPDTNQLHIFAASTLKIGLCSDEFRVIEESRIFKNEGEDSTLKNDQLGMPVYLQAESDNLYISITNLAPLRDRAKKSMYMDKIQKPDQDLFDFDNYPPIIFKFYLKDLVIRPQREVKQVNNLDDNLAYWRIIDNLEGPCPLTYFKSSLAGERPHYTFNVFIEPPISSQTDSDLEAKVDYSHCLDGIQALPENALLSIVVNTYFVFNQGTVAKFCPITGEYLESDEEFIKEYRKDSAADQLCDLLEALKDTHLQEFRSEGIIHHDEVVRKVCELCEANLSIKDLELNLVHIEHVQQIMHSLRNNYMIKTVKLMTEDQIKVKFPKKKTQSVEEFEKVAKLHSELLKFCEEFRDARVGTEIMLNTNHPRFTISDKKGYRLDYRQ